MRITVSLVVLVLIGSVARVEAEPPRLRVEHESQVLSIAWSPDGKWLATGCKDGTVRVFHARTGELAQKSSVGEPVPVLTVSLDSKTLGIVSADHKKLSGWNFVSDRPTVGYLASFAESGFRFKTGQFALGSNGNIVSPFGGPLGLEFFKRQAAEGRIGAEQFRQVTAIACDGSAGGSCDDKGYLHDQERLHRVGNAQGLQVGKVRCMAFIPGCTLVAVANVDNGIQFWDWSERDKLANIAGLGQPADRLTTSDDGNTLVALLAGNRRIMSWNTTTLAKRGLINHTVGKVHALAISPDGKTIATSAENGETLYLWDANAIRTLKRDNAARALTDDQAGVLWNDLGNPNGQKADESWQELGAAGDLAIPFLKKSILAHAVPGSAKNIDQLMSNLDSAKYATREAAVKDLVAAGELAILPLQRLLEKPPSLEAAAQAKAVLKAIGEPVTTNERIRVLEAIDLLEHLASAKAVVLLQEIERDALFAQIHHEAKQALKRIGAD